MIRSGYAPSVRLFEAAACGTPIISDWWPGLDTFFEPDHEILIAHSPEDTLRYLRDIPDHQRRTIAHRARRKALREHTATHRVQELVAYVSEVEHARAASVRGNDHEPPRPRTL
jgi:spore maturation protein CgeB